MTFLDEYDFELDAARIALRPVSPRHASKLLVVDSDCSGFEEGQFLDLPSHLNENDLIVFNNTRVMKAAVQGVRVREATSGGDGRAKVEVLFHKGVGDGVWEVLLKPQKRVREGDRIEFEDVLFSVERVLGGGVCELRHADGTFDAVAFFERHGHMPLPPYIAAQRAVDAQDDEDYQSVFAEHAGAVAAPTASLHFSPELLTALEDKGVRFSHVTLHVGAGTFLPVKTERLEDHTMHAEWGEVSAACVQSIEETWARGGRVIGVGTTVLRILEAAAQGGALQPFQGETDIFITPGFKFRVVDALVTNFHLPKSTLLALVYAFGGRDTLKSAYAHAIDNAYRFFSYGDGMLIWRDHAGRS